MSGEPQSPFAEGQHTVLNDLVETQPTIELLEERYFELNRAARAARAQLGEMTVGMRAPGEPQAALFARLEETERQMREILTEIAHIEDSWFLEC